VAEVVFDDVDKIYPDGFQAITDLQLDIADGEFLVLVGPSGCGKSTALRMIAGLETITSGSIRIGDEVVNDMSPKERNIAMVFQNYALYPHMTVAENIGFALKLAKVPRDELARRVKEAARILELEEHLDRKPGQLSGGQRQRVAMGRAIVREPSVFLLDEPLSNLDAKLRVQMRAEVARIQHRLGVTTFYVTHDQVEAMTLGDRVAVIKRGVLQQVAPPRDLYDDPTNLFVAGFIGSPAMNLYEGDLTRSNGTLSVVLREQSLELDAALASEHPGLEAYDGRRIVLGMRPEVVQDASVVPDHPATRRLRAHTELVESLGSEIIVHATVGADQVLTEDMSEAADETGSVKTDTVAKFDPRSRVREDEDVELAVDTTRLHFFDPDSGERV
jgi:multiple sugar transport system ATP-binding protein